MIPDGNLHLHKGMKSTRNGDYMGKYKDYFLILKFSLNDSGGIKTKTIMCVEFMGYIEIKCRTTIAQRLGGGK